MPKVSSAMSINGGLVGPKARPKGVADGQQVNIPVHFMFRPSELGKRIVVMDFSSEKT